GQARKGGLSADGGGDSRQPRHPRCQEGAVRRRLPEIAHVGWGGRERPILIPSALPAKRAVGRRSVAEPPVVRGRDDMAERVAVVTGAGTGIGQAIALALADTGVRTFIVGRRTVPLEETVARSPKANPVVALSADISKATDRSRAVKAALDHFGRIDIL